jgi:hypothetical protein
MSSWFPNMFNMFKRLRPNQGDEQGQRQGDEQREYETSSDGKNVGIKRKAASLISVEKSSELGRGQSKKAFRLSIANSESNINFTLPIGSNINKFCLVEYTKPIEWIKETDELKEFRILMETDPRFNYNNNTINKNKKYELYDKHKLQFDYIAELKKMHQMGTETTDGKTFAPKLHQIRIDNVSGTQGVPFSPDKMDEEFGKIFSNTKIKISYLIEKCDDSITEFYLKHPDKFQLVCRELITFIDSYVDTYEEFNTDCIKSENYCLTIMDDANIKIRLLDVDPTFCIKCSPQDDLQTFLQNAKVFMKYGFIANSIRYSKGNFGNLRLTQDDVNNMIKFFCKNEYVIYEYSPISMLYHYFAGEHPRNFADDFPKMPPLKLPEGWSEQKSTTTGSTYYANEKTRQTQFEIPNEFFYYGELSHYFKSIEDVVKLFTKLNTNYGIILEEPNHDEKTVDKSKRGYNSKTVDKSKRGYNSKTVDKLKRGYNSKTVDKSKRGYNSKTVNKSKRGGKPRNKSTKRHP